MEKRNTKSTKKICIITTIIIAGIICGVCGWYFGYFVPHNNAYTNYTASITSYNKAIDAYNKAANKYNKAIDAISNANKQLDTAMENAHAVLDSGDIPYDESTTTALSDSISSAQANRTDDPKTLTEKKKSSVQGTDKKLSIKELNNKATESQKKAVTIGKETDSVNTDATSITAPDYSSIIKELSEKQKSAEDSIKIMQQITNPSQDFIISRLSTISEITNTAAVTENHDPNNMLNKAGGYVAAVYFSSSLIDQSTMLSADIIDNGTDGGGCVEVFTSADDANSRNTYLSAFDNAGILNPGSHTVIGTLVVRTSSDLTASQQKDLESKIITCLTTLQ